MLSPDPTAVRPAHLALPADAISDSADQSLPVLAESRSLSQTATVRIVAEEKQDACETAANESIRGHAVGHDESSRTQRHATVTATPALSSTPPRKAPQPHAAVWRRLMWTAILLACLTGPTFVCHYLAPDSLARAAADRMPSGEADMDTNAVTAVSAAAEGAAGDDMHRCHCVCPNKGTTVVGTLIVGPDGSRCVCACGQHRPVRTIFGDLASWTHTKAAAHGPLVVGVVAVLILCCAAAALIV